MSTITDAADERTSIAEQITGCCLMGRTRYLSRVLTGIYDEEVRPLGMQATQLTLLATVAAYGPARRSDLGRWLHFDSSTLTRNLRVMLANGWIEEVADGKDGRGLPLMATTAGTELLRSLAPAWHRAQARAVALVGEQGRSAVMGLFDTVQEATGPELRPDICIYSLRPRPTGFVSHDVFFNERTTTMVKPRILVTGATGKTGAAVVRALIDKAVPVRALVHRRDERSAALERLGAEIVVADMFDPDQLLDALTGVQRAYYLPFFSPYVIQSAVAFTLAAKQAKLESLVHMGQWLSHRAHPAILTRQTWLLDQVFADLSGIAHTTINPGMFADNFLRVIDFAALLGIFPILTGDGRAAPVSNEDMARCAAAILLAPERYAGMSYRPTGPALLSGAEMAAVAARVVGHRVAAVKMPFWMFRKVAAQQRINPMEISMFRHYVDEMKRGTFALDGGVTSVVEDVTGRPAESFETIAARYAAMPFARATVGNRLRAVVNFSLTPFHRGYDLAAWDREKGFPAPPNPSLSIEDDRWREEHSCLMTRQLRPVAVPMPMPMPALTMEGV